MKSPKSPGKTSGKASSATVGKAFDAVKAGASAVGQIAGVFAEKERTRQVEAQAHAKIRRAEEVTNQVAIQANVDIVTIHAQVHSRNLDHAETMQRMSDAHTVEKELHKHRERVLDKLLESPDGGPEQLVDGLRALLPNGRH